MNNNQRDQKALLAQCKGVFSATGWLNHGTPEDPVPFADKPKDRDSFKGKQFAVAATKTGRLPSSYFQPKHLYLAEVKTNLAASRHCSGSPQLQALRKAPACLPWLLSLHAGGAVPRPLALRRAAAGEAQRVWDGGLLQAR